MSDLEFQRELSPEQMREALSLLDRTAGAQDQNLRIENLSPAEEVNPEPDHSSARDRSAAAPERVGSAAGEQRFFCAAGCQAST